MFPRNRGIYRAVLFLFVSFLVATSFAAAAPSITSLTPTSGAVGASVTIAGSGFGSTQGTSTVKFNGTTATITSWSATSIVAKVPTGATSGNVVVTVSGVASAGKSFTVLSTPNLTSLSVTTGAVGASVTLVGANFGATQGTGNVKFNGTTATVTTWSASSIAVTVPTGATTGNVVVTASGVPTSGINFTVVSAPSITSLTPTSAAVGASVTIAGTNFGAIQGTSTVKFNGTTATVTSWSATSVAATVPAGATTGNVVMHASGVDSSGKAFTVLAAPSITSLSITSGAVGAIVTITGTNFGSSQGSSTVDFNGTTAVITTWSATSITTKVPVGATTGNVVVHASGVDSNGKPFTVLPTPTITSLSVSSGVVGDSVTITGTNFGSPQGTSTVKFNGTTATATSWSTTTIVTTVPTGASSGNVVVTVSGVSSAGTNFVVYVTPTISSLSPNNGAVGTLVTINGSGFQATQMASMVTFNGAVATPTSWNNTQIKANAPGGATTGGVVVTVGGLSSSPSTFTVKPTPTISTVSAMYGAVGVVITITGTNFGSTQGSSTVKFNGTIAIPSSWSANKIVAPVPTGATSGNLVVHTSNVDVSAGSFKVVTITSLALAPATQTVALNSWQRFQAIATNSDGSTQDIAAGATWSSTATNIATIDSTGVLTAITQGQTTIQASFGTFNSSTALIVKGRSFIPVGSLLEAREGHTATLLPNGKVLIAGGDNSNGVLASAEIYDPATKSFTTAGSMHVPRTFHSATLLPNGKILIAGGNTPIGGGYTQGTATAEIYDPGAGTFTSTGNLNFARYIHVATLLQNGKVLLAGGTSDAFFDYTRTAEVYDPATGVFTTTGDLSYARANSTGTLLSDGTVLITGGFDGFNASALTEIYNPSSGTFSATTNLPIPEYNHTASHLTSGRVLLAGGEVSTNSLVSNTFSFDPTSGSYSALENMALARQSHTATIMPDGSVLIVGGEDPLKNLTYTTAEIYNPSTQSFLAGGATAALHEPGNQTYPIAPLHTATLLNDGTVLVVGGNIANPTAELYDPAAAAPISIQISPGNWNMVDGATKQFVAVDDQGQTRTDAIWSISDSTIATLQSVTTPTVTANMPGQATLTADVDGVTAQAQITVAPKSLQITPASANLVIGGTRQFSAVDESGRPNASATWVLSNTSLATITTGGAPTLTALAAGSVMLTATVEGVSNQIQVNISGSVSLVPGTALWTVPSVPGFAVTQMAQAVPGSGGPGFYTVQSTSDGSQSVIQAATEDGQVLWQTVMPSPTIGAAVPDNQGGLIVTSACDVANSIPMWVSDMNSQGGSNWGVEIDSATLGACPTAGPHVAVRQDGAVVFANALQVDPVVQIVNGISGSVISTPSIPASSLTDPFGDVSSCDCFTPVGSPTVDFDGSVYLEYEVRQIPYPPTTISATLSLLKIAMDGTTTTTQLASSSTANLFPGTIVPDGLGGVLATWATVHISPPAATQPYQAAYVSGGAVIASYPLPMAPATVTNGPNALPVNFYPVLGDSGNAAVSYGPNAVSFGLASGALNWNYQSQGSVSVLSTTSDGGTAINDSVAGVLELDSSGNPLTVGSVAPGALQYSWSGNWYSQGAQTTSELQLPVEPDSSAIWAFPGGNPSGSGFAEALCGCLVQSTGQTQTPLTIKPTDDGRTLERQNLASAGIRPDTASNCPICQLPAPNPPAVTTSCTTLPGSGPTFVIVVGDPGINNPNGHSHNAVDLFNLSAQTQANSLNGQGNNVVACRVSTIQDVYSALTLNGTINGGAYYFGHSGLRQVTIGTTIIGQTSEMFVGQLPGTNTNITAGNVNLLHPIQTANNGGNFFGSNASLVINGCQAGFTVFDTTANQYTSIAELVSQNLGRGVYAYKQFMHFSVVPAAQDPTINGVAGALPDSLPMYMVPDGAIGRKPAAVACTPTGGYCQ